MTREGGGIGESDRGDIEIEGDGGGSGVGIDGDYRKGGNREGEQSD